MWPFIFFIFKCFFLSASQNQNTYTYTYKIYTYIHVKYSFLCHPVLKRKIFYSRIKTLCTLTFYINNQIGNTLSSYSCYNMCYIDYNTDIAEKKNTINCFIRFNMRTYWSLCTTINISHNTNDLKTQRSGIHCGFCFPCTHSVKNSNKRTIKKEEKKYAKPKRT